MRLVDPIGRPGGREYVTQRPVWRVRRDDGVVVWAYIEHNNGANYLRGYPHYGVHVVHHNDTAGPAIAGAGAGALIGAAVGGPMGAVVGAVLGGLFGGAAGGN